MHFDDLSPAQVEVMNRMAGWASDGETIGYMEDMLPARLLEAVAQLERLGLVRVDLGWRNTRWWHMTERGRAVREHGEG
jgi:hypothetical protein